MSEAKSEEKKSDSGGSGESKLPMILAAVNTLAVLAVLGLVVYTKVLFKRPKISETTERVKHEQKPELTPAQIREKLESSQRYLMKIDPIQANLKPTEIGRGGPGAPPPVLKAHYVSMSFSLELLDASKESVVRENMPKFIDALLKSLGQTTVDDLTSVQGRFILRNRIVGLMNDFTQKKKDGLPVVTNVFFNDFMVQ